MKRNFWDQLVYFYKSHSVLTKLIIINVAIFAVFGLIGVIFFFGVDPAYGGYSNPLVYWMSIHSNIDLLLVKPWTIITNMFYHVEFDHILYNMITLYVGGRIFSYFLEKRQLIATYIIGGIVGAIFYMVAFNVITVFKLYEGSFALGASASVLAILIAIATYKPNYSMNLIFIGPVKLKYIAIVFVGIDLLSLDKSNPGGHIAHLGGAIWGFLYASGLKNGKDAASIFFGIGKAFKSYFYTEKKSKMRVDYKAKDKRPISDEQFNKNKATNQERLDTILDKISKSGYEKLTKEEKEFLFKMGNKN